MAVHFGYLGHNKRGDIIFNLVNFLEIDTRGIDLLHSIRVAELVSKLTRALDLEDSLRHEIILSAALHDIGKSLININILNKPGKLSHKEWNEIKLHPRYGAMLALSMGYSMSVAKNILYHHENSDGTGYLKGIKEDKIPLGAAIIRICDSYDAMRSIRPYRKPVTHDEAIEDLIKNKNKYKIDLLEKFINLGFSSLEKYYE